MSVRGRETGTRNFRGWRDTAESFLEYGTSVSGSNPMVRQPTYEELEQRVHAFEKESFSRIQAEKALLKSEERYRRITDAISDYIYTVRVGDG